MRNDNKINNDREIAMQRFGYICDNHFEMEQLKIFAAKGEDGSLDDLKILSHWSRSLSACDYDLRHPDFMEYRKHYQKDDVEWLPKGKTFVDMDKYLRLE